MQKVVLYALAVVLTVLFAGCSSPFTGGLPPEGEEFHQILTIRAGEPVTVVNYQGDVLVHGWDRNITDIYAVKKTTFGRGELDRVAIQVAADDRLTIESRLLAPNPHVTIDYQVTIPKTAVLERVETSAGEIDVAGTSGDLDILDSDGNVSLIGVDGFVAVSTSNGAISLENVTGIRSLDTTNGGINGTIGTSRGEGAIVRTSNAVVDLTFARDLLSALEVRTSNGDITLGLPANFNANLEAEAPNGNVALNGVILSEQTSRPGYVKGIIGKGGQSLRVVTSNGNITLHR
jgi:hypothetical protein